VARISSPPFSIANPLPPLPTENCGKLSSPVVLEIFDLRQDR